MAKPEIAFLHLGKTHDEFPAVAAALSALGVRSRLLHLDEAEGVDWSRYAAINVRECRNYHLHSGFLDRLRQIRALIAPRDFGNSMKAIEGSLDKQSYLPHLGTSGIALVPDYWPGGPETATLSAIAEATGWSDFVIKPRVSSKSWNTFRVQFQGTAVQLWQAGQATPRSYPTLTEATRAVQAVTGEQACFVQRFLPDILTRGEISYVLLGGRYSHAIHKLPAPDNWLAHEFFGGTNRLVSAERDQIAWAESVHERLIEHLGPLHYARIDAIPDRGSLRLLECELVVPRLFLREAGALLRYARVLHGRL